MAHRRLFAGLTLILAIAVVIVIVEINHTPASPGAANAAERSTATGAATVQRRNLVETDTESGTIAYAAPQTVYDRLSGTITWLPAVGQLIRPGQALFRVQDTPVILMDGSTPAYRDLGPSDTSGPDILQLNRDLVALGFDPEGIVADDEWQSATTAAVDVFQASLGETETGTLPLGQIVFDPGPQLVAAVTATAGSTGGGGGSSSASLTPISPRPEFVALTTSTPASTSTSTTQSATTPTAPSRPGTTRHGSAPRRKAPGRGGVHSATPGTDPLQRELEQALAALRAETAALRAASASAGAGHSAASGAKSSGSSASKGSGSSGSSGASSSGSGSGTGASSGSTGTAPAIAVLSTTSDRLVVTVDLPASSQSEAHVGGRVTVELPNNTTVPGRVIAVSSVAQSSSSNSGSGSGNGSGNGGGGGGGGGGNGSGGSGSDTVPVTIALRRHVSAHGLDQAAVSVQFAQARADQVLSVPVTALIATSGDTYAVQEAAAPHRLLPVTTGLFAAGYVQISGPGITPGLQVTNSQG